MLAALAGFYPAVADEPADDAGNAAALWRFLRMQASMMLACDFFQRCRTAVITARAEDSDGEDAVLMLAVVLVTETIRDDRRRSASAAGG